MANKPVPIHYVCTHEEALDLIDKHKNFWVSNCGCREERGKCHRSRIDVCLMFRGDIGASGSGLKKVSRRFVDGLFKEVKDKNLVARPFRNDKTRKISEGICFCCDDCCGYFLDPHEKCDKGKYIEKTDRDLCANCGNCVEVCYFKVRIMDDGELKIISRKCYGCGLCSSVCPGKCIKMEKRK